MEELHSGKIDQIFNLRAKKKLTEALLYVSLEDLVPPPDLQPQSVIYSPALSLQEVVYTFHSVASSQNNLKKISFFSPSVRNVFPSYKAPFCLCF